MATITATTATTCMGGAVLGHKRMIGASSALGLPAMATRGRRVRCSLAEKPYADAKNIAKNMGASLMAASAAATMSSPALALVDERMSTEGTGLSLGLSNNLLGWILLGVFGLIWALYFLYTSTLEEDEESGLSL
ncbi:hypothetical protein ACLOJK_027022 [Asimina triloba]